jgi:hypothetical protein
MFRMICDNISYFYQTTNKMQEIKTSLTICHKNKHTDSMGNVYYSLYLVDDIYSPELRIDLPVSESVYNDVNLDSKATIIVQLECKHPRTDS